MLITYADVSEHCICSMKMEQMECSETSTYIIQTPGNYPKENIIYSEHGESLKSRMKLVTTEFKSGGLHEKHVVATWNLGNHLSIYF